MSSKCPACAVTRDKIQRLRYLVWQHDIPSHTTPEYREHHESITEILKFIDEELLKKARSER